MSFPPGGFDVLLVRDGPNCHAISSSTARMRTTSIAANRAMCGPCFFGSVTTTAPLSSVGFTSAGSGTTCTDPTALNDVRTVDREHAVARAVDSEPVESAQGGVGEPRDAGFVLQYERDVRGES